MIQPASAPAAGTPPDGGDVDPAGLVALVVAGAVAVVFVAVQILFYIGTYNIVLAKDIAAAVGMAGVVGLWLLALAARGGGRIGVAGALAVVYLAYMTLRAATTTEFGGVAWWGAAWLAPLVLLVPVLAETLRHRAAVGVVIAAVAVATLVQGVYVLLQAAGIDILVHLGWIPGWSEGVVVGTHGNAHFVAVALMPVSLLLLAVALGGLAGVIRGDVPRFLAGLVLLPVALVGAAAAVAAGVIGTHLTPSQFHAAYASAIPLGLAGLAVAGIIAVVGPRIPRPAVAAAAGLLVAGVIVASSAAGRRLSAPRAIETRVVFHAMADGLIEMKPVWGWGPGTFNSAMPRARPPDYHRRGVSHNTLYAHSEWRQVAVEGGRVGLAIWAALIASLLWEAARATAVGPTWLHRSVGAGCLAGVAATLGGASLFGPELRWTGPAFAFWTVAGIAAGLRRLDAPHLDAPAAPAWPALARAAVGLAAIVWLCVTIPATVYASVRAWRSDVSLRYNTAIMEVDYPGDPIATGEEAVRLNPWSKTAYYKLAFAYLVRGRSDDALAAYRRIQEIAPDYAQVHLNLAVLHRAKGETDAAIAELERAVELEDNVRNRRSLADMYWTVGRLDDARRQYEAILEIPADDENGKGTIPGYGHDQAREAIRRLSLGHRLEPAVESDVDFTVTFTPTPPR
jgi:hypothetical protein